ncbi:MAG: hypothetical protein AB7L90_19195 [Hyphomicrobiaceae bacterium]
MIKWSELNLDDVQQSFAKARRYGAARRYRDRAGPLATKYAGLFAVKRDDPDGMTLSVANRVVLGKTFEVEADDRGDFAVNEISDVSEAFGYGPLKARKQTTQANEYKWHLYNITPRNHIELATTIDVIQDHERACLLSARPHPDAELAAPQKRQWHASERTDGRDGGALVSVPGYWRIAELDKVPLPSGLTTREPRRVVDWIANVYLKAILQGGAFVYQFSSSFGINTDDAVSLHIWFRSTQLMDCREWHAASKIIAKDIKGWDAAVAVGTQICFTARPILIGANNGPVLDHLGDERVGIWWGSRDDVDLGGLLERVRGEEAAKFERAGEVGRLARERSSTLSDAAIIRAYVKRWDSIARTIGDHDGGRGFDRPIFAMLCKAIELGETDRERCAAYLSEYLGRVIARRGLETRERGGKAPSLYLVLEELKRRFDDALMKVLGCE